MIPPDGDSFSPILRGAWSRLPHGQAGLLAVWCSGWVSVGSSTLTAPSSAMPPGRSRGRGGPAIAGYRCGIGGIGRLRRLLSLSRVGPLSVTDHEVGAGGAALAAGVCRDVRADPRWHLSGWWPAAVGDGGVRRVRHQSGDGEAGAEGAPGGWACGDAAGDRDVRDGAATSSEVIARCRTRRLG